jgi:coiled-coil domain-containing protein 130
MIAKGVRFNSNRKKCGRYLGTIIYKFSMSCPYCKNEIIIKTDPKNCEYLLVKGVVKYLYFREDEKEIKYDDDNNENQYEIEKMFCEKIDKINNIINDEGNNNNIDGNFVFDIYKIKNEEKDFFKLNKIMRENLRKEKEFYVNKEEYYNIKFKHLNDNNNKLLNKKRLKMENKNNNNNNKNNFINNIFNYKIKNKIQLKKI